MADKPIKSVQRVFEILELFDQERRPLAAKEISRRLGYPLMSAHELLKSMHQLGYADFDAPNWTYSPSLALPVALEWVRDRVERHANILAFVNALNEQTKETINISRRVDSDVKIIHGAESVYAVGVSVKVGTMMPVATSLTGIVSLALFDGNDLEKLLQEISVQDNFQAKNLDRTFIDNILNELSTYGVVMRCDVFVQGVGAICFPVYGNDTNEMFVIGVVGPSDRILANEADHYKSIKRLARQFEVNTVFKLKNMKP